MVSSAVKNIQGYDTEYNLKKDGAAPAGKLLRTDRCLKGKIGGKTYVIGEKSDFKGEVIGMFGGNEDSTTSV